MDSVKTEAQATENMPADVKNTTQPKRRSAKTGTKSTPKTTATTEPKKSIIPRDVDPDQYVTVRNGFQGRLVYISKKTGERFVWDNFGSEQEIELRELRNAKNSYKRFFENNWFMFDEDWIVDYLGVRQFYRNAVSIEEFDTIFENDADTIKQIVSGLSAGQKKSAAYRARVLIAEGKIDSNRAITALEESLGIELIER